MSLYFLVLDAATYHHELLPALSAVWRQHRFELCRALCTNLLPAVRTFAERYHTSPAEEPFLLHLTGSGPAPVFDRDLWRLLVGEVLLYAAVDVPEFQTAPRTLGCLLGAGTIEGRAREQFTPIEQAHHGSRDICFGGYYRPEHAGWNDAADVARLAGYLAGVAPERWTVADLAALPELADHEDRVADLGYACERLEALRNLYERAATQGQIIVCELL